MVKRKGEKEREGAAKEGGGGKERPGKKGKVKSSPQRGVKRVRNEGRG